MPLTVLRNQTRIQELKSALARRSPFRESPEEIAARSEAAVSLILRDRGSLEVLLIKRAEIVGDPWSGHMALPGGRRETKDPDLLETAVRETREETGIELQHLGLHLGRLSDVAPRNPGLPPLVIAPYVFVVPGTIRAEPNPREVDEALWVPLGTLAAPDSRGDVTIRFGNESREFPAFQISERIVWGLTHRILSEFLNVIEPLKGLR